MVRAFVLDHGGSWVQISSGARNFSEFPVNIFDVFLPVKRSVEIKTERNQNMFATGEEIYLCKQINLSWKHLKCVTFKEARTGFNKLYHLEGLNLPNFFM